MWKWICLSSVLAAVLSLDGVRGQEPYSDPSSVIVPPNPVNQNSYPVDGGPPAYASGPPSATPPRSTPDGIAPVREVDGSVGPSAWILYPRSPGCTCPVGGNGPLGWEIYLWNGVSAPISGNYMGRVMDPGWDIEGGGRTLFYNTTMDAAWVVELGVGNIHNEAGNRSMPATLTNLANKSVPGTTTRIVNVTMTGLDRTYGSVGVGREWYIWARPKLKAMAPSGAWVSPAVAVMVR